jgi:hypothetical protein
MQGRTRVCAWPLAAVHASFVVLAAARWLIASPAPAADAPAKAGSDTTIKITPFSAVGPGGRERSQRKGRGHQY